MKSRWGVRRGGSGRHAHRKLLRFAQRSRWSYSRITPAAAAEEIQRRRDEIGFSYFVFGADSADALAPVVAKLAGR
jgi:hypothetical protein